MATIFRNKRGLSQVVTTLIILVVSVLLAGIVTYYATNITMTRTQQEDVAVSMEHVWVNSTGAVAAFKLQNLGGRDILIDKIAVRSVACNWSTTYIWRVPGNTTVMHDLPITSPANVDGSANSTTLTLEGATQTLATPGGPVPLSSGGVLVVYIGHPDNISMDDIGKTTSITVFTMNGQYIVECNVASATPQP